MATITVTPIKTFVSGETVTPAKLNQLSQSTVALTAATIVAADIASNAVTTAKILNDNVTNAKLASGIDASKLTTGTLPIARIADNAVTDAKLSLAANAGEIKKALNADNPPPIFACRAWVNFDATRDSSGASNTGNTNRFIRASGNVSSVLKTATGVFTITFTTEMPDEHYAISGFANFTTSSVAGIVSQNNTFAPAAASCTIRVASSTTAAETNMTHNHVMFVR
jgi:hypothetical protein